MKESVKYSLAAGKKHIKRKKSEPAPGIYRNQFQRDRDRILYSKEFRRLSGKSQVFLSSSSDHVRTRLTHTLEVAQIATITCKSLKLDIDLCEAIALAHDVGHTPFGHVGERTLNEIMNGCYELIEHQGGLKEEDKGFKHNLQGLRVTSELERLYDHVGLNLTNFTLWGIKNHTKSSYGKCKSLSLNGRCYLSRTSHICSKNGVLKTNFYQGYNGLVQQKENDRDAWSFEGQVVKLADEIAQRHHDLEDALYMKIMEPFEFTEIVENLFRDYLVAEDRRLLLRTLGSKNTQSVYISYVSKFMVNFLNRALIEHSANKLNNFIESKGIKGNRDFIELYHQIGFDEVKNIIGYQSEFSKKENELREFLERRILNSFDVQRMDGKGRFLIRRLFKAYLTNPNQLSDTTLSFVYRIFQKKHEEYPEKSPREIAEIRKELSNAEFKSNPDFQISLLRGICDHIAGMTERYALHEFRELYG